MRDTDKLQGVAGVKTPFSILALFLGWLRIGLTSFGGGATTMYLIQEEFIYRKGWLTTDEYATIVGVSQIAPGINIFSITILIGRRMAGWRGVAVSLAGLIVPSAAVTVLITALYTFIHGNGRVNAALHTAFPAIFGIAIATNWSNVRPSVNRNIRSHKGIFVLMLGVIAGSAALYLVFNLSVILMYLAGGLTMALAYYLVFRKKEDEK